MSEVFFFFFHNGQLLCYQQHYIKKYTDFSFFFFLLPPKKFSRWGLTRVSSAIQLAVHYDDFSLSVVTAASNFYGHPSFLTFELMASGDRSDRLRTRGQKEGQHPPAAATDPNVFRLGCPRQPSLKKKKVVAFGATVFFLDHLIKTTSCATASDIIDYAVGLLEHRLNELWLSKVEF